MTGFLLLKRFHHAFAYNEQCGSVSHPRSSTWPAAETVFWKIALVSRRVSYCKWGFAQEVFGSASWWIRGRGELWYEWQPLTQIPARAHRWLWFCQIAPLPVMWIGQTCEKHPQINLSLKSPSTGQSPPQQAEEGRQESGCLLQFYKLGSNSRGKPIKPVLDFGWLPSSIGPSS